MHSRPLYLLLLLATTKIFGSTINASLPSCTSGSLQSYVDNFGIGAGGACTIGTLTYSKFFFKELKVTTASSLTNNITASSLNIDPVSALNSFNILPVSLSSFNRTIINSERYFISYNVDPPPIIAGDELFLDPPFGSIYGTKWGCTDSDFSPSNPVEKVLQDVGGRPGYSASTFSCGVNPVKAPYILKTDGTSPTFDNVIARITFPEPVAILNIRLVLDFEPGTITGFDGIQVPVSTTIPEPASGLLIAAGLAAVAVSSRKKFKA